MERDVPAGEVGEILVRCGAPGERSVMRGYYRMPEANAEAFTDGWLRTGDVGRLDADGFLYFVDRAKDMIVSGGLNIYSREVEIFLDSHPAVLESAIIGHPDEKWGEVCKACVVTRSGWEKPTPEELVDYCIREGLPRYKAPKIVAFVESLPKNENKKVVKKEIKRMSLSGDPRYEGVRVRKEKP